MPFRAAIDAGVPMVMSSHVAVPALNDGELVRVDAGTGGHDRLCSATGSGSAA